MTPGDVRRQAATLVGGLEVGAIFEQQKVFDVQVWTGEDLRNSPEKIRGAPDQRAGRRADAALGAGTVTLVEQPTVIQRESVQRRLDIVADIDSSGTRDAVATSLSRMQMPAEYHSEVRGEAAAAADNVRKVLLLAAAALLGVVLLLQAATRNWWTAVAAAAAIPLGMSGGFLAALLVGELTIGCLLGLVALAVLGVHNALTAVGVGRARRRRPRGRPRPACRDGRRPPRDGAHPRWGGGGSCRRTSGTRGARPPGPRHGRRCHHGGDRLAPGAPRGGSPVRRP